MKRWIFPIILLVIETILCVLLLSPSIFGALPGFLKSTLEFLESCFTTVSRTIGLPSSTYNEEVNYVFSNFILLFVLDFILISINFLAFYLRKRRKKKKENDEEMAIDTPQSEFDPILFEKKSPTLRLAFLLIPINLWILYYVFLNSNDMQTNLSNSSGFLYSLFAPGISFVNDYVKPVTTNNALLELTFFFMGLALFIFIYWIIASIFTIIFRKPFARQKAKKALKDHERRISACQKEEIVIENMEILEHAKFKHDKAIVSTIADIDKNVNPQITQKSDYFDDVVHGITDLGIVDGEVRQIEKPKLVRKPIQLVFPDNSQIKAKVEPIIKQDNEEQAEVVPEEPQEEKETFEEENEEQVEIAARFDALNANEQEEIEEKPRIKPLKPRKLREHVSVTPVKPITEFDEDDIEVIEVEEIK